MTNNESQQAAKISLAYVITLKSDIVFHGSQKILNLIFIIIYVNKYSLLHIF